MSNRAFGVEIECYPRDPGSDIYGEYNDGVSAAYKLLRKSGHESWSYLVTEDESLGEGGAEIKSPVLYGKPGFEELKTVVGVLNVHRYSVDERCGLHVHIDAPEFVNNGPLIVRTVKSWRKNQSLINNMVADDRINNDHCESWDVEHIQALEDLITLYGASSVGSTHRRSINVSSLPYHGSIEIRQHEGTLNYEEIESWVKFCQAFVDSMAGKELRQISSEELLLKRLKVEKNASRFLTTKARLAKERREHTPRR